MKKLKGQITYEQNFASVGFKFISTDTYSKTKTFNLTFTEDNITDTPLLTEKCITTLFNLSPDKIYVIERNIDDIIVSFNDLKASAIIKELKPFLKKCPAFLDNFTLSNSKASGKIVMFRPNGEK